MRKMISSAVVGCYLVSLVGCATIVGDKNQLVGINSTPDQAELKITDEMGKTVYAGQTPASITLAKGDGYFHGKDYTITLSKEGFSDKVVTVKSTPNGWYILGNLLFGGLIGWFIVDPATGAMWNLTPDKIDTDLAEKSADNGAQNLHIVLLKDVPAELQEKMVRIN